MPILFTPIQCADVDEAFTAVYVHYWLHTYLETLIDAQRRVAFSDRDIFHFVGGFGYLLYVSPFCSSDENAKRWKREIYLRVICRSSLSLFLLMLSFLGGGMWLIICDIFHNDF